MNTDLNSVFIFCFIARLFRLRRLMPERRAQPDYQFQEKRRGRAAPHIRRRSREQTAPKTSQAIIPVGLLTAQQSRRVEPGGTSGGEVTGDEGDAE